MWGGGEMGRFGSRLLPRGQQYLPPPPEARRSTIGLERPQHLFPTSRKPPSGTQVRPTDPRVGQRPPRPRTCGPQPSATSRGSTQRPSPPCMGNRKKDCACSHISLKYSPPLNMSFRKSSSFFSLERCRHSTIGRKAKPRRRASVREWGRLG